MTYPAPGQRVSWAVGPSVFTSTVWSEAPSDFGDARVWVHGVRSRGFVLLRVADLLPPPDPEPHPVLPLEIHDGPQ